jgi:D-xylose reductase
MPLVGFGIWKVPQDSCADAVYTAIKLGYRLIDGAHDYRNSFQAGCGVRRALDDGLCRREDLFITSKLWNNYHAAEHATRMARDDVERWGLDYLDLYLIHFPIAQRWIRPEELKYPTWWTDGSKTEVAPLAPVPVAETWAALQSLVPSGGSGGSGGFLRSIGVANFHTQLLYDLLAASDPAKAPLSVLQVEHHPYLVQRHLVDMAQENGIAVTAYSSFGPASFVELGNPAARDAQPLFENDVVRRIAEAHGRTPAQVLLRWATQRGVAVIPKSNHPERMAENLDCCSFDLTGEELEEISGLDRGLRFNDPGTLSKPIRIFT